MAESMSKNIETLVIQKVQNKPKIITRSGKGRESREQTKTTKEFAEVIVPDLAHIITVAISAAVASTIKDITSTYSELLKLITKIQRQCLYNKYDIDILEQYQRRDNIRIFGLTEDEQETEDVLEAKVIELDTETRGQLCDSQAGEKRTMQGEVWCGQVLPQKEKKLNVGEENIFKEGEESVCQLRFHAYESCFVENRKRATKH